MKVLILLLAGLTVINATAQNGDSASVKNLLVDLNRSIDRAVVTKDSLALDKYYADDFFFLHATGKRDSKASWFRSVNAQKNPYLSREHDSVEVELHRDVAIVAGSLIVKFASGTRQGYVVRYIRVFANRNKVWQMISHRSTAEWKLPME